MFSNVQQHKAYSVNESVGLIWLSSSCEWDCCWGNGLTPVLHAEVEDESDTVHV